MSYPRHMALWDRIHHQAALRIAAKKRQEAVKPILDARAKVTAAMFLHRRARGLTLPK